MIVNAVAIVIAYLVGSIPSGYIVTRLVTGKDIRQLGSGNVGALNTYRQVGGRAGIAVFLADMGKGIGAVAIANWGLGVSEPFLLLTILAAVVGHMWPVFLRFSGGRGMATSLGALLIFMPLYEYWLELLIFLGVLAIAFIVTHKNYALTMIIGMITIPVSAWFLESPWQFVVVSAVLLILVIIKVIPIARAAWSRSKSIGDFIRGQ